MAAKNASKAPTKAKKKGYSLSGLYDAKGEEIKRKKQTCPKCGPSFYLADHANRVTCGKCGYTEFKKN